MPLALPSLDTRTFDELVVEARALIPQASPDWTDHNLHDPGITLLELFAWLSEQLLFGMDRVSPAELRAFLRLVGAERRPAGVASTVVALRRPRGAAQPLTLDPGFEVLDRRRGVTFAADGGVTLSQAWLELEDSETTTRGIVVSDSGGRSVDNTVANRTRGRRLRPFGEAPAPGDVLRLGFTERPARPGAPLSLFAWAPDAVADAPGRHHDARAVWEYLAAPDDWRPLDVVADATRTLTRSGHVVLQGPPGHPIDPGSGRHWIRCRVTSGTFDCPPELSAIAVNAVRVRDAVTAPGQLLGRSRGRASQTFELGPAPVVAGSTRLRIVQPGGMPDDGWQEVSEWDRTGPADRHYRLDPITGLVRFGDGRTGRVPPSGTLVIARGHRRGGGPAGNVPAGRLSLVRGAPEITVVQPFAATGGRPAESIREAHGRALRRLAAPTRGVTADDLAVLARSTPGLRVGRAHAVPGRHPRYGCIPAAGVVTVVVLPACGAPPRPSPGFLRAVRQHLERTRLLTAELHVVGPRYVAVTVSAVLHAERAAVPGLAARAREALAHFLDPLRGGDDGTGWPLGRDVMVSEVMATLAGVAGVLWVEGAEIEGEGEGAPRCGNLPLCPIELPASASHRIAVTEG